MQFDSLTSFYMKRWVLYVPSGLLVVLSECPVVLRLADAPTFFWQGNLAADALHEKEVTGTIQHDCANTYLGVCVKGCARRTFLGGGGAQRGTSSERRAYLLILMRGATNSTLKPTSFTLHRMCQKGNAVKRFFLLMNKPANCQRPFVVRVEKPSPRLEALYASQVPESYLKKSDIATWVARAPADSNFFLQPIEIPSHKFW